MTLFARQRPQRIYDLEKRLHQRSSDAADVKAEAAFLLRGALRAQEAENADESGLLRLLTEANDRAVDIEALLSYSSIKLRRNLSADERKTAEAGVADMQKSLAAARKERRAAEAKAMPAVRTGW